jgi:hypothetical protein
VVVVPPVFYHGSPPRLLILLVRDFEAPRRTRGSARNAGLNDGFTNGFTLEVVQTLYSLESQSLRGRNEGFNFTKIWHLSLKTRPKSQQRASPFSVVQEQESKAGGALVGWGRNRLVSELTASPTWRARMMAVGLLVPSTLSDPGQAALLHRTRTRSHPARCIGRQHLMAAAAVVLEAEDKWFLSHHELVSAAVSDAARAPQRGGVLLPPSTFFLVAKCLPPPVIECAAGSGRQHGEDRDFSACSPRLWERSTKRRADPSWWSGGGWRRRKTAGRVSLSQARRG